MLIKTLIAKLKLYPPDTEILTYNNESGDYAEVTSIQLFRLGDNDKTENAERITKDHNNPRTKTEYLMPPSLNRLPDIKQDTIVLQGDLA